MARLAFSQLQETTPDVPSPPSSPQSSSDKENPKNRENKRQNAQMSQSSQGSKRRRLTDRASNTQSSQRHNDLKYYDPDQDEGERRRTRKKYRDLAIDFNDSRSEYLRTGNNGIYQTVAKANRLFEKVKQTSDATIDSRLLVNAADLSHKKTAQLALGDSATGIDVDEFVSKCISYMRRGPEISSSLPSTQNRRRPLQSQRGNDSEDETEGDAMNWDWLGRMACLRHNARPSVTGFLLGPLSVQKRARQVVQRGRRDRFDQTQAVAPKTLVQEDLDGQENSNLTAICSMINRLLAETRDACEKMADAEFEAMDGPPTPETLQRILDKCKLGDDGGVSLFHFCINPKSFGQSVENLFYVSFLVRDGTAGVAVDGRGVPTLHPSEPYTVDEAREKGIQKHQAIFSLDHDTWQQIIDVFEIKDSCFIPHREEVEETSRTWRG